MTAPTRSPRRRALDAPPRRPAPLRAAARRRRSPRPGCSSASRSRAQGAVWFQVTKLGSARNEGGPQQPFFALILGTGARSDNPDESPDDPGLADAMHVIGVNPALKSATIIDIPRDTEGPGGAKINSYIVNNPGGNELRTEADAVSSIVGVPITWVIRANFPHFQQMVDEIGGIDVNIPAPMDDDFSGAHFPAGPAHLNGEQALQFSRDRHSFSNGDISRTSNQGLLIVSALQTIQAKHPSAGDTVRLLATLGRHTKLDGVGINDLFHMGSLVAHVRSRQREERGAPGRCRRRQQPGEDRRRRRPARRLRRRRGAAEPLSTVASAAAGHRADACDTLDDLAHEHFDRVVANTSLPERVARPATTAPLLTATVSDAPPRARRRHALVAPGGGDRRAARRAQRRGRHRHRVGEVALLPAARSSTRVVAGSRDTTLLVFPTKALAQDQLRTFREWLVPDVVAATYDGDTPADERTWIRTHANVVLTNPEMLHVGILPCHDRWADVPPAPALRRGRRAAHAARRLRQPRRPRAAPPAPALRALRLVTRRSASPARPSATPPSWRRGCAGCRWRRSTTTAHRRPSVASRCGSDRSSTCTPARARRRTSRPRCCCRASSPTATRRSRSLAAARAPSSSPRTPAALLARRTAPTRPAVAAYRAGYLATERAPSSSRSSPSGELGGVVATSALELGIDVGVARRGGAQRLPRNAGVDAPAGRARRAHPPAGRGRARRGRRPARPVVRRATRRAAPPARRGGGRQPRQPVRRARADRVRGARAAAHPRRRALVRRRPRRRGARPGARRRAEAARRRDVLGRARAARRRASGCARDRRSSASWSTPTVAWWAPSTRPRAFHVAHPGRDLPAPGPPVPGRATSTSSSHVAVLDPADDADEHTQTREETDISIIASEQSVPRGRRHRPPRRGDRAARPRGVPAPSHLDQRGVRGGAARLPAPGAHHARLLVHGAARDAARAPGSSRRSVIGAVHAAEHALIGLLPLFAICDRWDVGGVSMALHPQTGDPTIFVYDGYPGRRRASPSSRSRELHASRARRARARARTVRATTAARRACSHPSAATGTSTSTRARRSWCSRHSARFPPVAPTPSRFRRMTRTRWIALVTLVVVGIGLLIAVVAIPWSDDAPAVQAPTVYHQGDDISVQQGDEFVIALPANPSTGYAWTAGDNPDVMFVSSHQVQGGSQPGAGGHPGADVPRRAAWRLHARARLLALVRARRAPGQDREVPGDGDEVGASRLSSRAGRRRTRAAPRPWPGRAATPSTGTSTSTTTAARRTRALARDQPGVVARRGAGGGGAGRGRSPAQRQPVGGGERGGVGGRLRPRPTDQRAAEPSRAEGEQEPERRAPRA